MTYHISDIIYLDENYSDAVAWCDENNATLTEIEPDGNVRRFQIIEIHPEVPTYESVKLARITYRQEHIDDKTLERQRKMANGSWTDEDEQAYLALDAEVTAYIEEHYPYPAE